MNATTCPSCGSGAHVSGICSSCGKGQRQVRGPKRAPKCEHVWERAGASGPYPSRSTYKCRKCGTLQTRED